MKTIIVIFGLIATNCQDILAMRISFGEAIKQKLINYKVISGEDHSGRRMNLSLSNKTSHNLELDLEPGRIFMPDMSGYQPFIVTRPVAFRLEGQENKTVWVQAVCGNSSKSSPRMDLNFKQTFMCSPGLENVLKLMADEKVTDRSFYQSVVWHFTNNHQIASVSTSREHRDTEEKIIARICSVNAQQPSWYKIKYQAASSGDPLEFSGIPDVAEGTLQFYNPERENLMIQLVNERGEVVNTLEMFINQPVGKASIPVKLDLKSFKNGKYTVRVVNEKNKQLKEMEIIIG